jgi:CubicO group peptidase (beta-lactamase class C family)
MKRNAGRRYIRTASLLLLFFAGLFLSGNGQGFSTNTTTRLQFVLDSFINQSASPFVGGMSAAINVDGLAAWQGASGFAARNIDADNNLLAGGTPFGVSANSRYYSITKTFTSPLVLELAREGYFSLDAPVSNFIPLAMINSGLNGNVTIRQLLGHQSGYSNYTDEYMLQVYVAYQPTHNWTAFETLSFVHQIAAPGAERRYSSTNYIMLGAIVEMVTGKTMEQHYRERFFTPLHYTSMYLSERETGAGFGDLVAPHDNLSVFNPVFMMTGQPTFPDAWTNISRFPMNAVASLAFSGGGIVGNAAELARWGNDLFGGRATSAATLRTMLQSIPSVPDEDGDYLGYGIWTNHRISSTDYFIGHNGTAPGYRSVMMYQPDRKMTIVVLTNFYGSDPYLIAKKLYESLPMFLCGNGNNPESKILICYKGKDLCIARPAVPAHIRNGAWLGSCKTSSSTTAKAGMENYNGVYEDAQFTVNPNPFDREVLIRFRTPENGQVKLELFDLYGKLLKTLYNGNLQKGMYQQVRLHAEGMANGMYICRLQTPGGVIQRKLMLNR